MDEATSTCDSCGASIYKQHLDSGMARYEDGKLMCKHCVEEYERSHDSALGGAGAVEFEPIQFEGEDDTQVTLDLSESRIHGATSDSLVHKAIWDEGRFKRPLDPAALGASRVRFFHSKLSEGALDYMNNQINDWLDSNEHISIKFCTATVGLFEGKHSEPNLFLTLFY